MQFNATDWSTHHKAEYAMAQVQVRAITLGAYVSLPTREGLPYDCIVDWKSKFYRVQVKFAAHRTRGSIRIWLGSNGKKYTAEQADAIVAYIPVVDELIWIPSTAFSGTAFYLRPEKENWKRLIWV